MGQSWAAPVSPRPHGRQYWLEFGSGEVRLPQNLYQLAGGIRYLEPQPYFYDIIQGESRLYQARKGWDLCTGLGSPKVSQIQESLARTNIQQ